MRLDIQDGSSLNYQKAVEGFEGIPCLFSAGRKKLRNVVHKPMDFRDNAVELVGHSLIVVKYICEGEPASRLL